MRGWYPQELLEHHDNGRAVRADHDRIRVGIHGRHCKLDRKSGHTATMELDGHVHAMLPDVSLRFHAPHAMWPAVVTTLIDKIDQTVVPELQGCWATVGTQVIVHVPPYCA